MYTPSELRRSLSEPDQESVSAGQKIYSAHAARQDIFRLPAVLDRLGAILIDIRFVPPVNPVIWNKDYLKLLTKKRYLHVPALGNRGTSEKPLIHNLGLGIKIITELKVNVLLFCACADDQRCHRHQIAKEFARQGREVTQINDWSKIIS